MALRSPYPGLRAYEASESDLFFGREDCVDEMLARLAETRFLAVLGNSGSGKSSLVRTGLLDALEMGFLATAGSRWKIVDMHPGGRPLQNLARAILAADGAEVDEIDLNLMRGQVSRGPRSVMQWCDEGNLGNDECLLLLVDQFEELFRYQDYAGREEAEAFVSLILESARSHPRIHVVLTMRSEYLGACALMPGLAEQINAGLYLTPRMSRAECADAIEGPAKIEGFAVEPRLVNHILNDMAAFAPWEGEDQDSSLVQLARRADQLPLMQHVLNRLWAAARLRDPMNPVLRFDDYEAVGGLRGAVNDHAEEVFAGLSEAAQEKVPDVFKALMSGTNISDAVRAPKPFAALVELVGDEARAREIVDAYRAPGCNFLRPPSSVVMDGKSIMDLGHESLIRQWGRLKEWLAEDTRAHAQWSRLTASQSAEAKGEGALLSGLDLDIAREWWSQTEPTAAWARSHGGQYDEVRDFLDRSIAEDDARIAAAAAERRRKSRNLRYRAAGYLGVAVVAVGTAIFAFGAKQEADEATVLAEAKAEEARAATALAEASAADARVAQAAAERSTDLALKATDTLLLDMIEQMNGAIGMPDDQVDRMMDAAFDFVDELEAEVGGSDALAALKAKVLLQQASAELEKGEISEAEALADEAQALLGFEADTDADLSSQQVAAFLNLFWFRVAASSEMRLYDQRLDYVQQSRDFFEKHRSVLSDLEQKRWDLAILNTRSNAEAAMGAYAEARRLAEACIARLEGEVEAEWARRRMHCAAALSYAHRDQETLPKAAQESIATALQTALESGQLSASGWGNWLFLQLEEADRAIDEGRYREAITMASDALQRAEVLIAAEPQSIEYRSRRNWAYNFTLSAYEKLDDRDGSYAIAQEAYETVSAERQFWDESVDGIVSVNNLLNYVSYAASRPPAIVPEADSIAFYLDVLRLQLEVRAANLAMQTSYQCAGCTLVPYTYLSGQYEQMYKLGKFERVPEQLANYDSLLPAVQAVVDDPDEEQAVEIFGHTGALLDDRGAAKARRSCRDGGCRDENRHPVGKRVAARDLSDGASLRIYAAQSN